MNAMDTGRPFHSFFNAYMDGKTNGIASNGLQMGHTPTAYKTGVLRHSNTDLLDEGGDIRDMLGSIMTDSIEDGGFQNMRDDIQPALGLVAKTVTDGQHKRSRELNKHITMTYGYGKEIESFNDAIEETLQKIYGDLQVSTPDHPFISAVDEIRSYPDMNFAKALIDEHYAPSMEKVNSVEGVEGRSLMRGAATMFALWDDVFSIKDPTGNDLFFGGEISEGYDEGNVTRTGVIDKGGKQQLATPHYETQATSAGYKNYTNPETGITEKVPGQRAYGGSIPGPVQSIDAATVAKTVTGKSWKKLNSASKGKPYIHTIYDAFKVDANSYDVALEEVNNNWMEANQEWSYLQETKDSINEGFKRYNDKMSGKKPTDVLSDQDSLMFNYLVNFSEGPDGPIDILSRKVSKLIPPPPPNEVEEGKKGDHVKKAMSHINKSLKDAGWNRWKPPTGNPTVAQHKALVKSMQEVMKYNSRISSLIDTTQKQKKEIIDKVKKEGYEIRPGVKIPLQYYAH